jgi:hypothetical protein
MTPVEVVAEVAAELVRAQRAKVVADTSNNSAFVGVLAARLPRPPQNWLIAASITRADAHAATPIPMAVTIGGQQAAVPRWTLSKRELIESVAAEMATGRFFSRGAATGKRFGASSLEWSAACARRGQRTMPLQQPGMTIWSRRCGSWSLGAGLGRSKRFVASRLHDAFPQRPGRDPLSGRLDR